MKNPLPINWRTAKDSNSYQRAQEQPALIQQQTWDHWLVTLADGEHTHLVQLHKENGAALGNCHTVHEHHRDECPGWAYHSGPCAHLCAIHHAAQNELVDCHGQPVRLIDWRHDTPSQHVEHRAISDGGQHR